MEHYDAVIVGGGVAGAAMGVALGKQNVNAVILERRKEVGEINRGDVLQTAAIATLDRLGVLGAFRDAGALKLRKIVFSHHRKGRLGHFDISGLLEGPYNYVLAMRHEQIETVLIDEAQRRGIQTRRGQTVRDIRREGDRMIVAAKGDEGECQISARLVIGADGKFSTVRKFVGPEPQTHWYDQECVVVEAERPEGAPIEMRMHYHPDGILVTAPISPTVLRVYLFSLEHDAARIFKLPDEEIQSLAIGRDPLLEGYRFFKRGGHVYKMGLYHCQTYVAENCALIGDAAHITSPAGAHGMNLAINDAEELAERVAPALSAGRNVPLEDLRAFESQRRQANEATLRQAHSVFVRFTSPALRHRLMRPLFFWIIANRPRIRDRIARPMLTLGASPSKRIAD